MPPIFNVQQREELKIRLLEIGFTMIKEQGLKKTTIDKVTQAASIAKGTFYHFYPSNELFVYEIMVYLRDGFKKKFEDRINEKGYLTRKEAME